MPRRSTGTTPAATKTAATKTAATKTAATKTAATKASAAPRRRASSLAVREGESAWTTAELNEVRRELTTERDRLLVEVREAAGDLAELLRDSGDGAGDDQADSGSKAFEREHEMSLAAHSREALAQTERALARIEDGSYGVCEDCGEAVGKARLQAFPRASRCVRCKQREERR